MASEILVQTDRILEAKNVANQLKQQTEELRGRLNSIKGSLDWKVASKEAIDDNLKSICDELDKQIQFMEKAASLCSLVVTNTDDTTKSLMSSIAKILLTIVGISAVIGGALNRISKWFNSGNGTTGTDIVIPDQQSTNTVQLNPPETASPTKPYQGQKYSNYSVVGKYDESYILNQTDPRWIKQLKSSDGGNGGCVVSSEAMIYNMKHPDSQITPPECGENGGCWCTNEHSSVVPGTPTKNPQTTRNIVGQTVSSGEPCMVRITGHTVTAIGVKNGADMNNLSNSDILCIDPTDGKVKTLQEAIKLQGATDVDGGWAVQVAN